MTKEIRSIIRMFLAAAIAAFTIAGLIHAFTCESKMEDVRNQTIEEAVLVSCDESGYTINFGGELHSYTFTFN